MKKKLPIRQSEYINFFIVPEDHRGVRKFRFKIRRVYVVLALLAAAVLFSAGSVVGFWHYRDLHTSFEQERRTNQEFTKERLTLLSELQDLQAIVGSAENFANNLASMVGIERPELRKGVGPIKGLKVDINDFTEPVTLGYLSREAERLEVQAKSIDYRLSELTKAQEDKLLYMASTPSIWPVKGWVTSEFGYRRSPIGRKRVRHRGIDIGSQWGTRIVAPAAGVVRFAGYKGALGRAVVIDHGYGIRSYFGHASRLLVRAGQVVKRGTQIAKVGSSGHSTGPHLHYEIHVDGVPVDPMQYVLQ
jgi:murein DD-endopeptidase MepM/ murein hydrolase activator NlpD